MKIFTLIILLSLATFAKSNSSNELTLHLIPPPQSLDWSTPMTLTKSAIKNIIAVKGPRFMGQVFVELRCNGEVELTSMTAKNFDYLNQLLIKQRGLGVLYHSFEGKLQTKEDILPELEEEQKKGHLSFVKYILNLDQCLRAGQYLNEYQENNVGRHYGLAQRPRYAEGAGGSAFGVSFLDVLDLLDQDMIVSWSHSVNIPLEFAGAPLTDQGVNIFKFWFNAHSWASESEKHQKLSFWDQDKMHLWIKKKIEEKAPTYSIKKIHNSSGIVFDKSHLPAPQGSIWRR